MELPSLRVLVIDPDPSIRALLAAVAHRRGLAADTAANREEALRYASSEHYAAVILEPRMISGDTLLHELSCCNNVIVATTSAAQPPGVTAVLRKPFDLDALTSALTACCAKECA
jgi:DNA-binding response OmpR family regulator